MGALRADAVEQPWGLPYRMAEAPRGVIELGVEPVGLVVPDGRTGPGSAVLTPGSPGTASRHPRERFIPAAVVRRRESQPVGRVSFWNTSRGAPALLSQGRAYEETRHRVAGHPPRVRRRQNHHLVSIAGFGGLPPPSGGPNRDRHPAGNRRRATGCGCPGRPVAPRREGAVDEPAAGGGVPRRTTRPGWPECRCPRVSGERTSRRGSRLRTMVPGLLSARRDPRA